MTSSSTVRRPSNQALRLTAGDVQLERTQFHVQKTGDVAWHLRMLAVDIDASCALLQISGCWNILEINLWSGSKSARRQRAFCLFVG